MKKLTYNMDVAFSDDYETLGESLEVLAKLCPTAWVRINKYHGSGGGWPDITVTIEESDVPGICTWYGGEGATPESLAADCDFGPDIEEGHPGIWD